MNTLKPIAVALFAIVLLIFLSACGPSYRVYSEPTAPRSAVSNDNPAYQIPPPGGASGRIVFAVTDAAANMQTVTSVQITVTAVKVHSAADGWVTVSSATQTYDLLQLKATGTQALIVDTTIKPGSYDQMRLDISSVMVTDANGTHQAKLPSGELKMMGQFDVIANATTTATFDFIVDESLHTTGTGEYILAPVVQVETRERVDVTLRDNKVDIKGGTIRTRTKVGMDVDGNVGVGLKIGKDQAISLDGEKLKIGIGLGVGQGNSGGNAQGNAQGNAGLYG